ncbi:MAG TPA: hypothetical protein VHW44_31550 [Pseudonocardiaceae bacterium]|jgi:Mce-associated membrane protein|nr:hypothetical protein [Pseudonocardiaceae bacterium]
MTEDLVSTQHADSATSAAGSTPDPDTEPESNETAESTGTTESPESTEPTGTAERSDRSGLLRVGLPAAALVLVVLALAAALVGGFLWYNAAHSDNLTYSRSRDTALQVAESGAVNFTTLDYRSIQQGLSRWKQSATGDLFTQLTSGQNTFESQVQSAKVVTTGKIVDGALTQLNLQQGTAQAIVLVDVTVKPPTGAASTKRLPLQVALTNTGNQTNQVWKLSGLSQISTGSSNGQ